MQKSLAHEMNPRSWPNKHYLLAAEGWIELGNVAEASAELENIDPQARFHPDVLALRWQIYAKAEKWTACIDIGEALVKLAPERSESWIHRSFSLHEVGRTDEAFEKLLPVVDRFPSVWQVPYNLSCYSSVLRRFDEAEKWFKRAMLVDEKSVQTAGIDDSDLRPLWDSMSGTIWKKDS
jgi:tetratricopeptide (TPR) repeat protein